MESLYFLMPLFFITIVLIPINIKTKISFDYNKKVFYLSFFLWKIKIILFKIHIKNNEIFITTKKKKKEIEFSLSIKQIYFVEQLIENLKNKTQFKKISIYGRIGTLDAYKTAMLCSSLKIFTNSLLSRIKLKKKTCSIYEQILPKYNKNIFIFSIYTSCAISIFSLTYSIIISLFSLRSKNYERSKRQPKIS